MPKENRTKVEPLLEELFARNGVLETMQSQLVLLLAGLTDDPQSSIRMTMADVTTNLARSLARAEAAGDTTEARIARRAVEYAHELAEQLVRTKRHPAARSTQ